MRSFFVREIIKPDLEKRNKLLHKLAYVKNWSNKTLHGPDNPNRKLIKLLKRAIRATEGHTHYYRNQKGVQFFIGDERTPKKLFLLAKDGLFSQPKLQEYRRINRIATIKYKSQYINSIDTRLGYHTLGGVLEKPNFFKDQVRVVGRKKIKMAKYPQSKDPYIGIELEYASKLTIDEVSDLIIDYKLHDQVRVMYDSSIRVNEIYPHQVEFCILTKSSELEDTLNKLKPIIFDKPQYFHPNNSCGLHVHLDCRHEDVYRVFKNLASMQSVLFNLVAEHRRDNTYCEPVSTTDFNEADDENHYAAISKYSYTKHETIEVRIHHSTLDLTRILKWINLLKKIADYKGTGLKIGTFDSEFKLLREKINIEPDLIKYIEEQSQCPISLR